MKKFEKWSAVIAAGMMLFALVACDDSGSSSSSDDNASGGAGSAASDGLQPVTEIDTAKLSAGTYKLTEERKWDDQTNTSTDIVKITGTNDDSDVIVTGESDVMKFSSKAGYSEMKAKIIEDYEEGDLFIFNDNDLTISVKEYGEDEQTLTFKEFKENYLAFPEDKETSEDGYYWKLTHTDKSLRMAEDGSKIMLSCTVKDIEKEDGETNIDISKWKLILERQ